MTEKAQQEINFNPRLFWATIIGICLIIITGSVFVTRSYRNRMIYEAKNYRLPYIGKLEKDLEAINRDGKTVHLADLKGKIYVAGYLYTDCPSGCLGLAAYMAELSKVFGERSDFQLVSISLNPSGDTPEKMNAFVKSSGVDPENWWFLTGDEDVIRKYMLRYFKLYSVRENTDPEIIAAEGQFSHDQRLVLVDGEANVRGYYRVMDSQMGGMEFERLKVGIKRLIDQEDVQRLVEEED